VASKTDKKQTKGILGETAESTRKKAKTKKKRKDSTLDVLDHLRSNMPTDEELDKALRPKKKKRSDDEFWVGEPENMI
jgi:hypothetical protein